MTNGLHVIFGASVNTESAIIRELVTKQKPVLGVARISKADVPTGVEMVSANALDLQSMKNAAEGATVIYHCLGIPYYDWVVKHPPLMTNIIKAATVQGEDIKIVFVDNFYYEIARKPRPLGRGGMANT